MTESHPCPKCGKPMAEEPQFPGLWMCPDYKNTLNPDGPPPYLYKCTGSMITKAGAESFENACWNAIAERN